MASTKYRLISHHLCPYVQRAAITLHEKAIPFERINVDLANKPGWFLQLSPLGKVPVLMMNHDAVLFESSVIARYLDEVTGGGLLSSDPLEKARQNAWMEFASGVIGVIGQLYNAKTRGAFEVAAQSLADRWTTLENNIADGDWFCGEKFSLVDAAFAPAFRYFEVIEPLVATDFFTAVPGISVWRDSLARRESVARAVSEDYHIRLLDFLSRRDSIIGKAARRQTAQQRTAVA